jgi:hypothetical protein
MKSSALHNLAKVGVAGAVLIGGVLFAAAPAQATLGSCVAEIVSTTQTRAYCTGTSPTEFRAKATCFTPTGFRKTSVGPWQAAGQGVFSYAFCISSLAFGASWESRS